MAQNGDEQRDASGRFAVGHRGGPGRPRGTNITAAIRAVVDPHALAMRLWSIAMDPKTPVREAREACALITNRLEGSVVQRSVTLTANAILPPGFDALSQDQKLAALLDVRERALAGELDALALEDGSHE